MNTESATAVAEALQLWTNGNQQGAIDRVRPLAEAEDPPALALICWFFPQLGEPRWREGVDFAEKAVRKGMGWVVGNYFGNMLNDPNLRQRVPDLIRDAMSRGWQIDPIAHAVAPYQQGDHGTALALIDIAAGPWPWPEPWDDYLARARARVEALELATDHVGAQESAALEAINAATQRVDNQATTLTTRTEHLTKLLEQLTNAEVQTYFDAEAREYESQANRMWKWGIRVLVGAAVFAFLPIGIYYVGQVVGQHWLRNLNLVAAHVAAVAALGTVSGVLLARARGRDKARQRARDLSVALGTMFVYSEQIEDLPERQRFVHEMGRTVIEAFLRQDGAPLDAGESRSLLSAIVRQQ
jgi:VIT1/CCC1 family predicted Fe2+/Mn2+ transporter